MILVGDAPAAIPLSVSCPLLIPRRLPLPSLALQATRVLVTHQLQYLPSADEVVVLRDGRVAERGTYRQLLARGVDFHQFEQEEEEEAAASPAGSKEDSVGAQELHSGAAVGSVFGAAFSSALQWAHREKGRARHAAQKGPVNQAGFNRPQHYF